MKIVVPFLGAIDLKWLSSFSLLFMVAIILFGVQIDTTIEFDGHLADITVSSGLVSVHQNRCVAIQVNKGEEGVQLCRGEVSVLWVGFAKMVVTVFMVCNLFLKNKPMWVLLQIFLTVFQILLIVYDLLSCLVIGEGIKTMGQSIGNVRTIANLILSIFAVGLIFIIRILE